MRDDNPFYRLFGFGGRTWTAEDISEFMERMEHVDDRMQVDGDVTVTVYRDGEWVELGEEDGEHAPIEVEESDGDYTLTLDVSEYIPYHNFDVSASLNNGVLEVSFEKK